MACRDNESIHDHSIANDTNSRPRVSTTSLPGKIYRPPHQERHRRQFRAIQPHSVARQMESEAAGCPPGSLHHRSVPHLEPIPLPGQDHPQLKKHGDRIPRIRYADSCNKPSPRMFRMSEAQRSGNHSPIPWACIYNPLLRYPESLPVRCISNPYHCPARWQNKP